MRAFVVAMECEAQCVRRYLGQGDKLFVSGIGKVNAASTTQRAIYMGADEVWNVGVCGGFGSKVEIGGVYAVKKAVQYDFDLAKLNGTRIGQLNEYDSPYVKLTPLPPEARKLPALVLATGDRFSDSEDDYELIVKELGASLRDMEGAAIAHICYKYGIPCRSIKCVTNKAGHGSMIGQYDENLAHCLDTLTDTLKDVL